MASIYEELGGTYHLGADGLCYPNLLPPEEDAPAYGKYGRMRRTYLQEHHESLYPGLLLSGRLNAHLNEIDAAANAQIELITKQMAAAQDITEELKARDQMAWVGAMENVRGAAEEICSGRAEIATLRSERNDQSCQTEIANSPGGGFLV